MSDSKLVMVVEDDEALRDSVCELLQEVGYRTEAAEGGRAALEKLRSLSLKPDLVLLDLMMPGMNGWQFRAEQLADASLAEIPVVVMTASRELRGIEADEVVLKPLKLSKLLSIVERVAKPKPRQHTEAGPSAVPAPETNASTPPDSNDETPCDHQLFLGRSALARRMRAHDWIQTPLGPTNDWPQSLRSALGICLGSSFPIAIYWGPQLALLYNDAWSPILGSKHPWALGRAGIEVWPELWETIGPMFDQVRTTSESTYSEDSLLLMNRYGYVEECYFNYTFTPIRGAEEVEGIFNAVIETTFRVIAERRSKALRTLAEATARATSPEQACSIAAQSLAADAHDVPFCALYLLDESGSHVRLVGVGGMEFANAALAPTVSLDARTPDSRESGLLGLGSMSSRVELLSDLDAHFPPLPGGPWPVPATSALVAPLMLGMSSHPSGFLIVGVSPRRAVDEEYRQFVERAASHVATVVANVTALAAERKRAEALAAIDRAKTAFFSNISHEFRTPLTLMLGPVADILAGVHGALTPEQRNDLTLIERNGLRLQKLVNALLDFSRLEAGKARPSYEPVDLPLVTRELASAFESAIQRAGLTYAVDIEPIDGHVFVDRDMWEKIVLNLLSNALKFTLEGRISIAVRDSVDGVHLSVSDTGIGIADAHLPLLFERFHRVEGVKSRTHEGSGIGLALVHELTKLHGGSVSVESQVGVGTTFTITLPKGHTHLPQEHIRVGAKSERQVKNSIVAEALSWLEAPYCREVNTRPEAGLVAGGQRILLADDNADMRDYVRRHLARYWQVEVASDGLTALQMALQAPPDLILTDVMMPGLDGFGLLNELRKHELTSSIPVIMLSARSGEEARIEGLQAGATDYLVKPFAARELLARVRIHLQLVSLRDELRAQREHLYALFLHAPIPIAVVAGKELTLELANTPYCELVGKTDVVGRPLLDALPELRGQGFDGPLHAVMNDKAPYHAKELLVQLARTGIAPRNVYLNVSYVPFRGVEGAVDRVIATFYDVTEQVLARQEVERAAARVRFMAEAMPQKIFTAQPDGRVDYINARWSEYTGLPDWAMSVSDMARVVHPDDVDENIRAWQRALETAQPIEFEHRFRNANGEYRWHLTRAHLMRDEAGQPVMWVGSSTDIDQVKQAEAELQQAVSFSETFVGILGHDLRNPLNAITAAAQLLELRAESEKIATPVSRIIASANRMARMIVQLLDFTRVRLGRGIGLLLTNVNLAEVSRSIIDELEATYQAGIELHSTGDVVGTWDHDRLAQLLSNLIANACHHGNGDRPVTVHLDGNSADAVLLRVQNGGVIPEELLPIIFEPLRLDRSREKRKGSSGLGLGLYISQQIVRAHAGKIWVESTQDRGTTFHISLPRFVSAETQSTFAPRTER